MKALPMTPVSTERHTCAQSGICSDNIDGCSCTDAELIERPESAVAIALRADGELVESGGKALYMFDYPLAGQPKQAKSWEELGTGFHQDKYRAKAAAVLSTQGKRLAELEADRQAAHETSRALHRRVQQAESSINIRRQVLAEAKATGNGYADGFCRLYDERQSLIARAEAAESALSTAEARALEKAWRPSIEDDKLCRERAMQQWEASLSRPDLDERSRVLGAVDACLRQMLAISIPLDVRALSTNEAGK